MPGWATGGENRGALAMNASARRIAAGVHAAFHEPETAIYRRTERVVAALIVLSIALLVGELLVAPSGPLGLALDGLEAAIMAVFFVEIGLRLLSYRPPGLDFYELSPAARLRLHVFGRLRYAARPLNLIDIATLLTAAPALRSLRALRLLRLLRTQDVFRYGDPLRGVAQAFRDNQLLLWLAMGVVFVAVTLGGLSLYLAEGRSNPEVRTLWDGLWWALVTLTTVGYGDLVPQSAQGRLIGAGLMLAGLFTIALFAGIVSSTMLNRVLSLRTEQFRMSEYIGHIVICGYEAGSRMLLDVLSAELDPERRGVVVFAQGPRPADVPPAYRWIDGDPTKESELPKARVAQADKVIVVGARSVLPQMADARTILTVFTIRRALRTDPEAAARRRPLYIAAEILDEENVEHARDAGADEVIETTLLGFSLLAHAMSFPGTAATLAAVAAAGGQSLFVGRAPLDEGAAPVAFGPLAERLRAEEGILLLGLLEGEEKLPRLNPAPDRPVTAATPLIYLAPDMRLPPA